MHCVTIDVVVKGNDCSSKLRAAATLLKQHSSYFRAYLDFSSKAASADAPCERIEVLATKENAWCMQVVLNYMETGHIQQSVQANAWDLLLLLQYADYLGCNGLIQKCLQHLLSHMQNVDRPVLWSIIAYFQLHNVVDVISRSPVWKACCRVACLHAVDAMQDMECVLNSLEGCKRLVSLSHDTMLHICRSCGTKVAYESSIVAAITLWYTAHPTASQQQLQELASTVCLRGLPGMFMASVVGRLSWWKQAMGEGVLLQALQLLQHVAAAEKDDDSALQSQPFRGDEDDCDMSGRLEQCCSSRAIRCKLDSLLQYMPANNRSLYQLLLRHPRQSSGVRRLVLTADLTQDQLQQAYVAGSSNTSSWHTAGGWQTFAGVHWQLMYKLAPAGSSRTPTWQLSAGVRFNIPGIMDQASVTLQLPDLHLQHPLAVAMQPPLTRLQTSAIGFDPSTASYVLPGGTILPCMEVLPLSWPRPACKQLGVKHVSRFLNDQGCLPLKVAIERLL